MLKECAALLFAVLVVATLGSVACLSQPSLSPLSPLTPRRTLALPAEQVITIGDVGSGSAAKKIERLLPLADYLAEHLSEFGIRRGDVVIAGDTDEMAQLISDKQVDIYIDSPYPTLQVQKTAGSRIIARRWKDSAPEYWSTYVAFRDSGIIQVEDLVGGMVAFEEPHSTSGVVLPAGTLIQRGYSLTQVTGPDEKVEPDEIGYFFSGDEENSFQALLQGKAVAAGVSNQDYEELPAELKMQIVALVQTIVMPRQLVSVAPSMGLEMVDKVSELLMKKLHATHPDIKVLFTSGYTGDYLSHLNTLTTGTEFLAKPYMPDALAVKVREVLDQRAAVPSAQRQPHAPGEPN